MDSAPWLLAHASANVHGARFLHGAPPNLPLPAASMEMATCRQHTPNERPMVDLGEARRVLAPGGLLGLAGVVTSSPGELVAYGFAIADTQFLPATEQEPSLTVVIARLVDQLPGRVL